MATTAPPPTTRVTKAMLLYLRTNRDRTNNSSMSILSSTMSGNRHMTLAPAILLLIMAVGSASNSDSRRAGSSCNHPPGCWCAGSPPVPTCPPVRHATWWLTTDPPGGPIGGPSNLEFIQQHRGAVTRVAAFCWTIDNGTFAIDERGCSPELFGPIQSLGVEIFPAGSPTRASLLNNTWLAGLEPLARYAVAHNWTGVHVDFEEGTSRMEPGLVSEQLYAYFLETIGQVMEKHGLLVEVDVGENFPVQDRKLYVDQFYIDSLGDGGKLAIMGPTYYNDPPDQNKSKDLIQALTPAPHRNWNKCGPGTCGGASNENAMFGIQLQGAVPHQDFGWRSQDFGPMLNWTMHQGVCEIGIYTSPQGNSLPNNSWTKYVASWMLDAVTAFLNGKCSCTECACTNCTARTRIT